LLIVAGAVVGVLAIAAFIVTRPGDPVATAPTAAPAAGAALDGGAPGTLQAPLTTETAVGSALPGETSPFASVPTPAPDATNTVETFPLPPMPFVALQPAAPGPLAIYPSPDAAQPSRRLPNPVQVSASDPSAVGPLVLLERRDAGQGWLEVFLPVRPNGSTGYVRAADVKATSHSFHIAVHLAAFNLKVYDGDRVILDAPIAEAADNTPTPGGLYYTNMLLKPPDPNGPYGTYAYGLSGYSDTLTSFGGGPGQLGIHGTNEPAKMGQKVSHGCIRLRNQDIEKLAPILPLGVPVQIFP
jgi:lipoprotein-anchoring transpeptidase ErfK/SrfK